MREILLFCAPNVVFPHIHRIISWFSNTNLIWGLHHFQPIKIIGVSISEPVFSLRSVVE
jgi:hypothetical protein